jgi:hypothetical protein
MARRPQNAVKEGAVLAPSEPIRVMITHYKVTTSQGRLIAGQKEHLPKDEAERLIESGHAVPC